MVPGFESREWVRAIGYYSVKPQSDSKHVRRMRLQKIEL